MQHWFVYYKLDAAAARTVEPSLRRMQLEIAGDGSVRADLMRRCDGGGDLVTLLETYGGIARPEAFEAVLAAAVCRAKLPPELLAQRRTEKFEAL